MNKIFSLVKKLFLLWLLNWYLGFLSIEEFRMYILDVLDVYIDLIWCPILEACHSTGLPPVSCCGQIPRVPGYRSWCKHLLLPSWHPDVFLTPRPPSPFLTPRHLPPWLQSLPGTLPEDTLDHGAGPADVLCDVSPGPQPRHYLRRARQPPARQHPSPPAASWPRAPPPWGWVGGAGGGWRWPAPARSPAPAAAGWSGPPSWWSWCRRRLLR